MILAVAWNRLLSLKHDRAAFVLAFVLPVVFFSIFALIFGGARTTTRRVPVLLVDEDQSETSRRFLAALQAERGLAIRTRPEDAGSGSPALYDRSSARSAVRAGRAPLALIVPRGFGDSLVSSGAHSAAPPRILVLADSSDPVAPPILIGLVQKAVMTSMPDAAARNVIAQMDRWGAALTADQKARLEENASRQQFAPPPGAAANGRGTSGLVEVDVQDILGETKKNPTAALLAAGLGVMFLLFSAAGAGGALIEEAESGTLDRVLSTRVSMTRLLVGKLVYLTCIAFAQLTVMFVWAEIFFGVDLHRHIAGFVAISLATALSASTFGLLLAALSRSRMQLVAIANLLILVMSALGGSMVPRYLLSEKIQKLGLWTINAWAIDGFMKVFWREEPLWSLWPQVTVLVGASVLLFAVARRLAKRWDVA